jgi:hypothetical protein
VPEPSAVTVSVRPWPLQEPTNALTSGGEDGDVVGVADEVDADEVGADEVGAGELDVGAADVDGKSVAELGATVVLTPGLPRPVVVLLQAVTANSTAASRAIRRRRRSGMARG